MKILLFFLLVIFSFFYIGCGNDYKSAINLIKEKKYDLALENLEKISKDSKEYSKAQSKKYYIEAIKNFESDDFDKALEFFARMETNDEFKIEKEDYINKIFNSPKYIYIKACKQFNQGNYQFALQEFNKIPQNSEEYQKSRNKVIFSIASEFIKNDKLDTALTLLETIGNNDEIYNKVFEKLDYIEKRKDFIKAKDYYENSKYDEAEKILNDITNKYDFFSETKDILNKIENKKLLTGYQKIKSIIDGEKYFKINGKINLEISKRDIYELKTHFDKFSKANTFKEILTFEDYYYKDFDDKGGLNPKYGQFFGYFEVILQKDDGKSFTGNMYQLQLDNWMGYKIDDTELRNKMSQNPQNYRLCFIYKIDYIKYNLNGYDVYSIPVEYYVLDKSSDIVYKSEKHE